MDRLSAVKAKQQEVVAQGVAEKAKAEKDAKRGELALEREKVAIEIVATETSANEAASALQEVSAMEANTELDEAMRAELAAVRMEAQTAQETFAKLKARLAEIDSELLALAGGESAGVEPTAPLSEVTPTEHIPDAPPVSYADATTIDEALQDTKFHSKELETKFRENPAALKAAKKEVVQFMKGGEDSEFTRVKNETSTILDGLAESLRGSEDVIMQAYLGEEKFNAQKKFLQEKGWQFRTDELRKALAVVPGAIAANLNEQARAALLAGLQASEETLLNNYKRIRGMQWKASALDDDAAADVDWELQHPKDRDTDRVTLNDLIARHAVYGGHATLEIVSALRNELTKTDEDRRTELAASIPQAVEKLAKRNEGREKPDELKSSLYYEDDLLFLDLTNSLETVNRYPANVREEAMAALTKSLETNIGYIEEDMEVLIEKVASAYYNHNLYGTKTEDVLLKLTKGLALAKKMENHAAFARLQQITQRITDTIKANGSTATKIFIENFEKQHPLTDMEL